MFKIVKLYGYKVVICASLVNPLIKYHTKKLSVIGTTSSRDASASKKMIWYERFSLTELLGELDILAFLFIE